MADDEDLTAGPLSDRLVSSKWKVRQHAYIELTKLFTEAEDDSSPVFNQYASYLKKIVNDKQVIGQEKGMEAIAVWCDRAPSAPRVSSNLCDSLIEKCLTGRPKTAASTYQCFEYLVERDCGPQVLEALIKGCGNKVPKVVNACVETLCNLVRDFGCTVFPKKELLKHLPSLFEHSDKKVRDSSVSLAVELYKCLGAAPMQVTLQNLRSAQLKQIEEEFAKVQPSSATPTKFTRSAMAAAQQQAMDAEPAAAEEEELDAFSLSDAVDVLGKLSPSFYENLRSKKWKERKDQIDMLVPLVKQPRLRSGDYTTLAKTLKKVIATDVNVMIVASAAEAVGYLAAGLRQEFSPLAKMLVGPLTEKYKEKKVFVQKAIHDALDNIYKYCLSLNDVVEEIQSACANKIPSVRLETLKWVDRCLRDPPVCHRKIGVVSAQTSKSLAHIFLQGLDDSGPDVRDAAAQAFGALGGILGERMMQPYLAKLDNIKAKKVKDSMPEKPIVLPVVKPVETTSSSTSTVSSNAAKQRPKGKVPQGKPARTKSALPTSRSTTSTATADVNGNGKAAPIAATKQGNIKKAVSSTSLSSLKQTAASSKASSSKLKPSSKSMVETGSAAAAQEKKKLDNGPPMLSVEEAQERAVELFGSTIHAQLSDSKWQSRKAAVEAVNTLVDSYDSNGSLEECKYVIIRTLLSTCGLNEINFSVLNAVLECLTKICQLVSDISRDAAFQMIAGCIDKIGDVKSKSKVKELFSIMAECPSCTPGFVIELVVQHSTDHRNPKVICEALGWIESTIREFGFDGVSLKPLLSYVKKAYENSNPAVRKAATQLLVIMRQYVGPKLRDMLHDLRPAILNSIDQEFEKVASARPPTITRHVRTGTTVKSAIDSDSVAASAPPTRKAPATLSSTTKSSDSGLGEALAKSRDKSWQTRKEGLTELKEKLTLQPLDGSSLSLVISILRESITDSNPMIEQAGLSALLALAQTYGPQLEKHLKGFFPELLVTLQHKKHAQTATDTVSAIASQVSSFAVLVEFFAEALENSQARKELLALLLENIEQSQLQPADIRPLIKPSLACLQDRSVDVRRAATSVLQIFVTMSSYDFVLRYTKDFPPNAVSSIMNVLEKLRGDGNPQKQNASQSTSGREARADDAKEDSTKPEREIKSVFAVNDKKSIRALEERNFKWFDRSPEKVHHTVFKTQSAGCIASRLLEKMCSGSVATYNAALAEVCKAVEGDIKPVHSQLDLILKWLTLCIASGDASVEKSALGCLMQLFSALDQANLRLTDYEAECFFPAFVHSLGVIARAGADSRATVSSIIKLASRLFPSDRLFQFILLGLSNEDEEETVLECLQQLSIFICIKDFQSVCSNTTSFYYKIAEVYKRASNGALSESVEALLRSISRSESAKEEMWRTMGSLLSGKKLSLLEERVNGTAPKEHPIAANIAAATTSTQSTVSESGTVTSATLAQWYGVLAEASEQTSVDVLKQLVQCFTSNAIRVADGDLLFENLTKLTREVFSRDELSFRFANYTIRTWMTIFSNSVFVHTISLKPLQGIVEEILNELPNPNILAMKDSSQGQYLLSSLNQLVITILDNSDRTSSFIVLLRLLHNAVSSQATSKDKFIEYICKCLLKLAKTLRATINTIGMKELLMEINTYFVTTPKNTDHPTNPHGTVKIILNELVRLKGGEVLTCIRECMPDTDSNAVIHAYVERVLASNHVPVSKDTLPPSGASSVSATAVRSEATDGVQPSVKLKLVSIFKNISSKEEEKSQAALKELHSFLKDHPEVDLDQRLESTSQVFRNFVKSGLSQIAAEEAPDTESDSEGEDEVDEDEEADAETPYEFKAKTNDENDQGTLLSSVTQSMTLQDIRQHINAVKLRSPIKPEARSRLVSELNSPKAAAAPAGSGLRMPSVTLAHSNSSNAQVSGATLNQLKSRLQSLNTQQK